MDFRLIFWLVAYLCFSALLTLAYAAPTSDVSFSSLKGLTTSAPSHVQKNAKDRFALAVQLIQEKRLEAAKVELIALNRDYSELPEPLSNLAVVYVRQNKPLLAADVLHQALQAHPNHPTLVENLRTLDGFFARLPLSDPLVVAELSKLQSAVERWKMAWTEQQVGSYLSYYSASFSPAGGLSKAEWVKQRTARLPAPSRIDVSVHDLTVKLTSSRTAEAVFNQAHATPSATLHTRKRLKFVRESDGWKIQFEQLL